jgi:hypothetical protein
MRHAIRLIPFLLLVACDVSDEDERRLGADYSRQINAQVPLVTDSRVTGYVNALGSTRSDATSRSAPAAARSSGTSSSWTAAR